jgi:hypothetical protein
MAFNISELPDTLFLGNQGEVGANEIEIDVGDWVTLYPAGTFAITYTRSGSDTVYSEAAGNVGVVGDTLTWTPGSALLYVPGRGSVVFVCTEGDVIKKTCMAATYVGKGHGAAGDPPALETSPMLTNQVKTNSTSATDLTITTGTAKTLVLATPVYDDIIISATNLRTGNTAPAFASFISPVYAMSFVDSQTDVAYGSFELPHSYKEGTALEVHVHWSPSTTSTGNCVWKFNAVVEGMESTGAFSAISEMTATDAGGGVAFAHQYASFGTIAGTGRKIGDIIVFELKRPSGDTFAGDAFLLSIGIHYQQDTLGSRSISSK